VAGRCRTAHYVMGLNPRLAHHSFLHNITEKI
jgi:hypothetical protein